MQLNNPFGIMRRLFTRAHCKRVFEMKIECILDENPQSEFRRDYLGTAKRNSALYWN